MSKKERTEARGEPQFRVDSILDKRFVCGRYEYLVKMRGPTTSYKSWATASSIKNCGNLLLDFERNWAATQSIAQNSMPSQNVQKRKRSCSPATPQKISRASDIIDRIIAIDAARASLAAQASSTKRGRHSLETTVSSPESTSSSDRLLHSISDDPLEELDQARFFREVSSRRTSTPLPPAHDDDSTNDAPPARYLIQKGECVRDVLGLCPMSRYPEAKVRYDCNETEVVPISLLSRYQPEVLLRYYQRLDYL